jgi:N-hydroxyarylamine O-acetyltransferase
MTLIPDIAAYLDRIGFSGPVTPSFQSLRAIHRAHLQTIPYENLDIHLGRRLELGAGPAFRKLVLDRRGGWCYEMNGLLAWALGELGFEVRMVAGTVGRETNGDRWEGNHLVLLVPLDGQLHLVDVGFGDGPLDPLPLLEGAYRVGFLDFRLERSGERWVLHNHEHGGAKSFDFMLEPRELSSFETRCHELQTLPSSGFVQKTVCQRYQGDELITLRGAVFRRVRRTGVDQLIVTGPEEYREVLEREFDLRIPEADQLWPKVWHRHLEWIRSLEAVSPAD